MGTISTILAALLCATAPVVAVEMTEIKTEQTQFKSTLGKEKISALRAAYENGEYDAFLKEMDNSYKQADLSGLIEMRQKPLPADYYTHWEDQFLALQKQKNQELLAALPDNDNSLFAQKVRSLAGQIYTPEQEKSVMRLGSFIAKAPNTGANSDENKLIDIDLEYEYKLIHAAMPTEDTSPEQRSDRAIVLRMEKMDKMVKSIKNFHDLSLKQAVGIASAYFDASLARNLDGADLNKLVKSKVKPSNETEERIFAILTSYQGQFSDLMKQLNDQVK